MRPPQRDQRGMTMIETILAVFLTTLLALPLMGWAMHASRQQVETQRRNVDGTSLGMLRTYFVRDVTTAQLAFTSGDATESCGASQLKGPAQMVLVRDRTRIAYGLAPGGDGELSMWRLVCDGGTEPVGGTELVSDVLARGTEASCTIPAEPRDTVQMREATAELEQRSSEQPEGPAGCRQVTLSVSTAGFEQAVMTASLRVGDSAAVELDSPSVVISAEPLRGPRRLKVQFSSAGSSDPGGGKLSYVWNFGDGATSEETDPVHAFERVGRHTVTLVATNAAGVSSSATIEVEVLDNAPVAVISEPANGTVTQRGTLVRFSSRGSNDELDAEWGGRIVTHEWDFGDGTTSTEANPQKTYQQLSPADGFVVRLTVTDDAGQQASETIRVVVQNRVPTVRIVATPDRGSSPLAVTFRAVVEDEPDMERPPPLAYSWDFGDGATSTAAEPPTVTFTGAGVRTITLTVLDDAGASATATTTVTVDATGIGPPTRLRQTNSGQEQGLRFIELAWDRVEGADRYEVLLRCEFCDETATGSESGTTVRIRGLSTGRKDYLATVRARDARTGQWGPWSAEVRVRS